MSDYKSWQDAYEQQMNTALEDTFYLTREKIPIKPLYTPTDVPQNFIQELPGQFPFTRGVYASGYKNKPWTLRQYAGFSSAEDSNAFYHECIKAGQQGISVAFDLATHRGYDSDHERVAGDVGKAGVAIDSVEDMKILFRDLPLDQLSVSMTMNGAVLPVMAFYIVAAEESGVAEQQLSGTLQNDILKEFMVRNTYIYPPEPSLRIVQDIIGYCSTHLPKFNPISISGYHMQEAGADAALELAYTLANGKVYVEQALAAGLNIDQFAPRLSFFFGMGMQFFMEIAKLRAARVLWASLMKTMGAKNPKSMMMRCHCQTSGWSLTAQDPYNNVVRTTIEAMAAVFGGTQSLHTNAFDEALALPSQFSARLARNTQLILQQETDVTRTQDPFGGSYMMESLTASLCERVQQLWQEIEEAGGMIKAVQAGFPQRRIAQAAAEKQVAIDQGQDPIIGVNCFQVDNEQHEVLSVDTSAVLHLQGSKLQSLKSNRNTTQVHDALQSLKLAATDGSNLLAAAIQAARVRATLGEISEVLEEVFGRYQSKSMQVTGVFKQAYERDARWTQLKNEIDQFSILEGRRPRILIAKLGQDGHDRGAKVIAAGFVDLGFDVDLSPLFTTPDEILRMAIDQDVHIIGISSLAGAHTTLVPELLLKMKAMRLDDIAVVVGGVIPPQDHQALFDAGVTSVATPGTPVIEAAEIVFRHLRTRLGYDSEH